MERTDETTIRTFNTAKKYADELLFPLLDEYKQLITQSDFGARTIQEATLLSEEMREIGRFNGLKGANDVVGVLLNTIASTIRIKENAEELKQLLLLIERTNKVKNIFYEYKERFFSEKLNQTSVTEVLNRVYFEKVKAIIQNSYTNTEMLMTKNKLLFNDSADEFKSDKEIMDDIRNEYIQG